MLQYNQRGIMSCKFITKTCSNCKNENKFLVRFYNDDNMFDNYNHFKDLYIEICPHCNFIARDVQDDNISYVECKDKFKNIDFFPELQSLDEDIFFAYPYDTYEKLGIIKEHENNKVDSMRAYYMAYVLKIGLITKLINEKYEGEKHLDGYIKKLEESASKNIDKIISLYDENMDLNATLLFIEALNIKDNEKAKKFCDKLNLKDEKLKNYFDNLLRR